ncbi:RNA polymerase sigma factor SigJ [Actinomadura rudentiformis]|uniref:Sigma-70 family RNA polymerase sigma factor n=1 Tax=Actinomadura rudentiformis TaxID=359158 RepID=A0A6H9YSD1_9ACTN|nr:RNA polymerase sigma factor SigJ [Actinomadura rudentiformis]KAB2344799.1 sigma-70 family RNA polymerase sigma factor [Actinomadura rudentiformis]
MTAAALEGEWERHRPAVFGVAYRLLGGVADAEDVVQEVWLRASSADLSAVRDLRAWLVTVAARISYNVLKSARVRRESYVGPWLPEPLLTGPDAAEPVLVDESVGTAMLIVMEELTPPERVAFVLHDVFDVPFDQIAEVLDRTSAAARKLASRARQRVAEIRERPPVPRAEHDRVLAAFRAATEAGDLDALIKVLHPEAVYIADGGGKALAARKLVRGAARVAALLVGVEKRRVGSVKAIEVNGEPGLVTYGAAGEVLRIDTFEIAGGRVVSVRRQSNPEKLQHIDHT